MSTPVTKTEDELYTRIASIIEASRSHVSRSINTAMVHAYWLIGREIVEVEQQGEERAEYGTELMKRLAERLTQQYGKGLSARTLRRVRQFYLVYPEGSALSTGGGGSKIRTTALSKSDPQEIRSALLAKSSPLSTALFPHALAWSHYLVLMKVDDPQARSFYEIEAVKESWSTRELERQVASMLFERLTMSQDKDKVLALAKEGQQVLRPLPARRGRGADGRHRALLREERRHGPHHPARGQRADPRQPIPALPPHRGAAP